MNKNIQIRISLIMLSLGDRLAEPEPATQPDGALVQEQGILRRESVSRRVRISRRLTRRP